MTTSHALPHRATTTPEGTASSPVEAIDRALLVLEVLARSGAQGMPLADLAASLGLNKTTVHRSLAALRFRDFASQDPTSGHYLLGAAAVALGDRFLSEDNLPALLHPALLALSGATGELVHLGVLSGTQIVYLDKVEPERSVRVFSAVGRRNPAATTALGRALLAARGTDRAALRGYTADLDDEGIEERAWRAVERARERGYAVEERENEPDITCVAVALARGAHPVAAVSITAPAERMSAGRLEELHSVMRSTLPDLLPGGLTLVTS